MPSGALRVHAKRREAIKAVKFESILYMWRGMPGVAWSQAGARRLAEVAAGFGAVCAGTRSGLWEARTKPVRSVFEIRATKTRFVGQGLPGQCWLGCDLASAGAFGMRIKPIRDPEVCLLGLGERAGRR